MEIDRSLEGDNSGTGDKKTIIGHDKKNCKPTLETNLVDVWTKSKSERPKYKDYQCGLCN